MRGQDKRTREEDRFEPRRRERKRVDAMNERVSSNARAFHLGFSRNMA